MISGIDRPERPAGRLGAKKLLTFALAIVVGLGAWFGVQWLLKTIDSAPSAENGYVYVAEGYSVSFPGEPEVTAESLPGTDLTLDLVSWSNRQKQYFVAYQPLRQADVTLESVTESGVVSGGGTAVESSEYTVEGGVGMVTRIDADGKNVWLLVAFPEAGDGAVILTYAGDELDDAFFASLKLS